MGSWSLCILSGRVAPASTCTGRSELAGVSSAPEPRVGAEHLMEDQVPCDLGQDGEGGLLRGMPGPGVFWSSSSEGEPARAPAWCPGACSHLPRVWVQDGSMARGCGMERRAGSLRT